MGINVDRLQPVNTVQPTMGLRNSDAAEKRAEEITKNPEKSQPSKQIINEATEDFEKGLAMLKEIQVGELHIEFDEEADMKVVKIVDKESGEVIKEIPAKEMVELAKSLNKMLGILFDEIA